MVLKPRAAAPQWLNEDNPDKSGKCLKFRPTRESDPWFAEDETGQLGAAAICNGSYDGVMCPLRDACLEWALLNHEQYGVWGGMLPHDLRALRIAKRSDPYMELQWHPPTPVDQELSPDELAQLDLDLPDLVSLVDASPTS